MLFHVGCVSCRVTLWGEFVDPNLMKDSRSRCFTLGLWFHVGFRADLVMFFMLFRVGFMSVMLGALKFIPLKTLQNTTSFSAFSAMAWTEQNTLFHVGLGFRVGFVGAQ